MEFLLDNPFILIFIIAMLSSMFGKGKGKNQQKQNQPARPRQAPVRSNPIQPIPAEARNISSQIKREYLERKRQEEEQRQEIKNMPIKQEFNSRPTVKKQEKSLIIPNTVPNEKKPALSIEKQKLVDGVIWAEILGPPRALNPHRSINRKIK